MAENDYPVHALFANIIGQDEAVEALRRSAHHPVHAYLFLGPSGAGAKMAAQAFATSLICPQGGCRSCEVCQRGMAGIHPDITIVERSGAAISVEDARRLVNLAQRKPFEAHRQVLIVKDVHLSARAAPALLKTIEEPPASTIFILLADDLPSSLVTIASRCVEVLFRPITNAQMLQWLNEQGVTGDQGELVVEMAAGDLERAALLAKDRAVIERAQLWRSIPSQLDGSGATIMKIVESLVAALDSATAPLKAAHEQELEELGTKSKEMGMRGVVGRKEVTDRQAREERRWRNDELRAGLSVLARSFSDAFRRAVKEGTDPRLNVTDQALEAIGDAARSLRRNPQERLLLESLLVRLDAIRP
jgi:DNA polymerase-3 subunit delta'